MKQRALAALLLLLSFLLAAPATAPAAAQAQPADQGGPTLIHAAYDDLMSLYYKPLQPSDLLEAGWRALTRAATQSNFPSPKPLPPLSTDKDAAFATFSGAYAAYLQSLPPGTSQENLGSAIANGMASSLNEDHTNFLPPSSYRSFLASLGAGDLPTGFGIRTTGGAPWIVTEVAPNSPADMAGIKAGDTLISSDGADLSNATAQEFAQATGGAAGVSHTIIVDRADTRVTTTITRGTFYFPPLRSRMLPGGVGYVALEHFPDAGLVLPDGTEITSDFDRQLTALTSAGATGLVLDLRGNGGGDTLAAEEILGRFLPPNAETVVRSDQRGHAATGIVAGTMLPVQLPLVVLVDGESASSSELVASTLREANRAILVGKRTAGALATSEILPLPEDAGIQIAVAEQVTVRTGFQIDGVGFPVDIDVADSRTSDDVRAGRDAQLQAAADAVARAPAPPAPVAPVGTSKERIGSLLSGYMPDPAQMPTNDRLGSVTATETLNLTQPNEWEDTFGFGGRDPLALQQTLRTRGWIGSHVQNYNARALVPPTVSVVIDLYATAAGADDALRTNDFPDQQVFIPAPIQLGDGTVATRGTWLDLGGISLSWRRGNAVLNVGYGDVPGFERMETLGAVAKIVDAAFTANPLRPSDLPVPASATSPPVAGTTLIFAGRTGVTSDLGILRGSSATIRLAKSTRTEMSIERG
jgi:carboxyl-terminal processing protease